MKNKKAVNSEKELYNSQIHNNFNKNITFNVTVFHK